MNFKKLLDGETNLTNNKDLPSIINCRNFCRTVFDLSFEKIREMYSLSHSEFGFISLLLYFQWIHFRKIIVTYLCERTGNRDIQMGQLLKNDLGKICG